MKSGFHLYVYWFYFKFPFLFPKNLQRNLNIVIQYYNSEATSALTIPQFRQTKLKLICNVFIISAYFKTLGLFVCLLHLYASQLTLQSNSGCLIIKIVSIKYLQD